MSLEQREIDREELWASLFRGLGEDLHLVDTLGIPHSVHIPDGISCPSLSTARSPPTVELIKFAMLHALAHQTSYLKHQPQLNPLTVMSPEAAAIADVIDSAIRSSNPDWFIRNCGTERERTLRSWKSTLVDRETDAGGDLNYALNDLECSLRQSGTAGVPYGPYAPLIPGGGAPGAFSRLDADMPPFGDFNVCPSLRRSMEDYSRTISRTEISPAERCRALARLRTTLMLIEVLSTLR